MQIIKSNSYLDFSSLKFDDARNSGEGGKFGYRTICPKNEKIKLKKPNLTILT